jgi:hypothetical protein
MIGIPEKNTNNNATFLKIPNKSNDIFKRYSEAKKAKQYELQRKLMYEIRLRKFAIECGFTTWDQLINMFDFLKYIYANKLVKYFDFKSDINNNESNGNNNNLNFLNNSNNENANDNNEN